MLIKFLGVADLISALIIFASGNLPEMIVMIAGVYLIAKGVIFGIKGDAISFIDTAVGIYAVLIVAGTSALALNVLSTLFLAQKGFMSFL